MSAPAWGPAAMNKGQDPTDNGVDLLFKHPSISDIRRAVAGLAISANQGKLSDLGSVLGNRQVH